MGRSATGATSPSRPLAVAACRALTNFDLYSFAIGIAERSALMDLAFGALGRWVVKFRWLIIADMGHRDGLRRQVPSLAQQPGEQRQQSVPAGDGAKQPGG